MRNPIISEFCQIRNKPCFSKCDKINTLVGKKTCSHIRFLFRLISDFLTNFFFFIKMGKVCEAPKNILLALTILKKNSMTISVKERYY